MALYDAIGKTYAQTRKSDPRISAKLLETLESSKSSVVLDIGAGTGSYSLVLADYGYRVFAVEPAVRMRDQAIIHPDVQWVDACAENLPLPDQSADAAIIMLALHHFQNYQQALQEVCRVIGVGQLVLFTYDPDAISHFWLTQYFPTMIADVQSTFLPIPKLVSEIETITHHTVEVLPFPLPHDLVDAFAAVGWSRPELYLDSKVRAGISAFAKISKSALDQGLVSLSQDLEQGVWDQKYGHLRHQEQYDLGYRFVYTHS